MVHRRRLYYTRRWSRTGLFDNNNIVAVVAHENDVHSAYV